MVIVPHTYSPLPLRVTDRRGLAERLVRKRLERQGWLVWRGQLILFPPAEDTYPTVRRKYDHLRALLEHRVPQLLDALAFLAQQHYGIPDFLCYKLGRFKFVECKLEHEQLSERQRRCIIFLVSLGFDVEVHKIVCPETKTRRALVDIIDGKRRVQERQMILRSTRLVNESPYRFSLLRPADGCVESLRVRKRNSRNDESAPRQHRDRV